MTWLQLIGHEDPDIAWTVNTLNEKCGQRELKDDRQTRNTHKKVNKLKATSERGPLGYSASKPVRQRGHCKGLMWLQGLAEVLCCVIYSGQCAVINGQIPRKPVHYDRNTGYLDRLVVPLMAHKSVIASGRRHGQDGRRVVAPPLTPRRGREVGALGAGAQIQPGPLCSLWPWRSAVRSCKTVFSTNWLTCKYNSAVDVRARALTSPLFLLSHEIRRDPAEADHDLRQLRTSSVQAHEVSNRSALHANPAPNSRTLPAPMFSRSVQILGSSLRVIFSRLLFN